MSSMENTLDPQRLANLGALYDLPLQARYDEAPPQLQGQTVCYPAPTVRQALGVPPGTVLTGGDWLEGLHRLKDPEENALEKWELRRKVQQQQVALRAQIASKIKASHEQNPGESGEWFPLGEVASEPHVIKEVQKCARELLRMKGEGNLRMENKNQWINARRIIEDQAAIHALGTNHLAKLWVGWMVLPEERRTDLRMTGYQELVRQDPKSARFFNHFIAPLNESFGAPAEREMALRTLHERFLSQVEKESLHSWWVRIVALACKAYGDELYWPRETWRSLADLFVSRALQPDTLVKFAEPDILANGTMTERMAHVARLDERLGEGAGYRVPHHPLANGIYHRPREPKPQQQPSGGREAEKPQSSQPANSRWAGSRKTPANSRGSRPPTDKSGGPATPMDTSVAWLKRDGNCGTCNRSDSHEQPCTRPRACWTCGATDHVRRGCPKSEAKPTQKGGVKYCPPPPS